MQYIDMCRINAISQDVRKNNAKLQNFGLIAFIDTCRVLNALP